MGMGLLDQEGRTMIRELTVQEGATCTSCRIESLRLTEIGVAGPLGQDYDHWEGGTGQLEKSTHRIRSYSQHEFFKLKII